MKVLSIDRDRDRKMFENGDPIPAPSENVVYVKDPECEKQVLELMDKVKDLKKISIL